jgi:Zn-dependent protease
MFDQAEITSRLSLLIPMILSLSVHEWAHAFSAKLLGDTTAEEQGRCTINPLVHIDIVGTIIVPMIPMGGLCFGWAKPVPVNPVRFRRDINMRFGFMLTALAGPVSNICLAVLCSLLFAIFAKFAPGLVTEHSAVRSFLVLLVGLNMVLAFFNLMPFPPLDGSRAVDYFMPRTWRPTWERIYSAGPISLVVLILLMQFGGSRLFVWPQLLAYYLINTFLSLFGAI